MLAPLSKSTVSAIPIPVFLSQQAESIQTLLIFTADILYTSRNHSVFSENRRHIRQTILTEFPLSCVSIIIVQNKKG
jgi:hypothetical protein